MNIDWLLGTILGFVFWGYIASGTANRFKNMKKMEEDDYATKKL
jgi:hypothetical protein